MKLLVIDEEFPYPLNTGKRLRTFNLLKVLVRSHDVTYLAYGTADSESARFVTEAGMTPLTVPAPNRSQSGPRFYLRLLSNLFSPDPYIVTSHYTAAFQEKVRQLIATSEYDLVICEWTPYAQFVRYRSEIKKIIVAHNIEASIWRRYEENESNPLKKAYISIQRAKVERFEKNAFRWSHGATAVSRAEADTVGAFGVPYEVEVVENGVDLDYFQPTAGVTRPRSLVFTGSMDWRPNQDAAAWFVRDILPLVRRQLEEVTFTIVGRRPPAGILDLGQREGVTVTGTVDDVRPFVAAAELYVVPLRVGGGSRLKILEAMAMEKPVLSTTVGAEGLRVTDGREIVISDQPAAMADGIVQLLSDPERRRSLAMAGRKLVRQEYGWDRIGERFNRYLNRIAGGQ